MALGVGEFVTLTVVRETDFGYFLTTKDQEVDILLHKREATRSLELDEEVKVFLYHDHQNRIAATMQTPILSIGEIDWLRVVGKNEKEGLFLYNGISRDLFLSKDDLPPDLNKWPNEDDHVLVSMGYDKRGRLMAKRVKGIPVEKMAKKADKSVVNKDVKGRVYHFTDDGSFIFTEENHLAFLHRDETDRQVRLGEEITARVIFLREDGRLNLSMKPRKEESRIEGAEIILEYMESRGGAMPFWDKTPAEDIMSRFQLSKAAFKRALGKLMKEGKIYQENGWTYKKEQK